MHVQTIIEAGWVMPMAPKGAILEHHSVLIDEGKIVGIVPTPQAKDIEANERISLPDHIVLPGMVNAHTHAPMHLLRGMGADLALMDWLQTKIWPAEGKLMSHEFCYEGSLIAGAEMIESGITCASDHYFFSEDVARGLTEAGLKCSVSGIVIGFPSAMAKIPMNTSAVPKPYLKSSRIATRCVSRSALTLPTPSTMKRLLKCVI